MKFYVYKKFYANIMIIMTSSVSFNFSSIYCMSITADIKAIFKNIKKLDIRIPKFLNSLVTN